MMALHRTDTLLPDILLNFLGILALPVLLLLFWFLFYLTQGLIVDWVLSKPLTSQGGSLERAIPRGGLYGPYGGKKWVWVAGKKKALLFLCIKDRGNYVHK